MCPLSTASAKAYSSTILPLAVFTMNAPGLHFSSILRSNKYSVPPCNGQLMVITSRCGTIASTDSWYVQSNAFSCS